jgi:hypothetical protein
MHDRPVDSGLDQYDIRKIKDRKKPKAEVATDPDKELRENIAREWEEAARKDYEKDGYAPDKINQLIELTRDEEVNLILKSIKE